MAAAAAAVEEEEEEEEEEEGELCEAKYFECTCAVTWAATLERSSSRRSSSSSSGKEAAGGIEGKLGVLALCHPADGVSGWRQIGGLGALVMAREGGWLRTGGELHCHVPTNSTP